MATKELATFTETELKDFLSSKRALVVSAQQSSSRAIRKLAMQLGTKADLTNTCANFEEAKKELVAHPTHLLITDLFIEKEAGLELITLQESIFPNRLGIASLVMCGDLSSDAKGMIAETNVDAVLIKPFHFENFKSAVYQALENKVKPSEYWKLLEKGKEHFQKNENDQAVKVFEAAKKLDPKPTLCFYYLGEIHAKKTEFSEAEKCFEQGLALNPKDYQCLNAIFSTKMSTAHYDAAYEIASQMHKYYPVSPNRILDLVKLSIYTKKFDDVISYYEVFKKIEKQNIALSKTVVAAMLICAKYFHLKKDSAKALEVLQNAAKISQTMETLRIEVLRYYLSTGYFTEGERFYNELPEATREQIEYKLLSLELLNASGNFTAVVQVGCKILNEDVKNERLFEMVIEGSRKIGRSDTTLDALISEAKLYFPEKKW